MPELPLGLAPGQLLALRCSPEERDWGGPGAMLNLGACAATVELLTPRIGATAALRLHIRGIASFGQAVHGLDPDDIEALARRRLRGATDPDAAVLKGLLLDIQALFRGGDRPALAARTRPSSSRPPPAPWRGPGTPRPRASCARPRARRMRPASA